MRTSITKVDDFENGLADFRQERKKEFKDNEKIIKSWINDAKKTLRIQIQGVEKQQKKINEDFNLVKDLDKEMKTRVEEETRLTSAIREMESTFSEIKRDYKEFQQEGQISNEYNTFVSLPQMLHIIFIPSNRYYLPYNLTFFTVCIQCPYAVSVVIKLLYHKPRASFNSLSI